MNQIPRVVVGAFIRNSKNQILLVKSPKWGDLWVVPGGHVDWGESYHDTVIREVEEEIGVKTNKVRLIDMREGIFPKEFHEKKHFIYLQCECHILDGQKIQLDNREVKQSKWFSLDEALELKTYHITKDALKKLKEEHASK